MTAFWSRPTLALTVLVLLMSCHTAAPPEAAIAAVSNPVDSIAFPVQPEVFIREFRASEGITFNAEGRLFIGANRAIWLAEPDGSVTKIADVDLHLGQAGIGRRDILACDFGPLNVFRDGANDDGVVWRITPEGEKTVYARGIADPNAALVLPNGSVLISDDGIDKIYEVQPDGTVSVWSSAVEFPNGLALSLDEKTVYVAQIFKQIKPVVPDDRLWAIPIHDGKPAGPPVLVAQTGEGGIDGLAMDELGRVYIADNGGGKIWRVDPGSGEKTLIAEGMTAVASLVFGEGAFDHEAIYATSTQRGGGTIWKVPVGVRGAKLHR